MPLSKYTKPPGPFPPIEQIRRSDFRFTAEQHSDLARKLPNRLRESDAPAEYVEYQKTFAAGSGRRVTWADVAIMSTEYAIQCYLRDRSHESRGEPLTPAHARAAIRRLREALKPFREGWLDQETCDLIPPDLDARLEKSERELEALPVRPAELHERNYLCGTIGDALKLMAEASGVPLERAWALEFIAYALDCAKISYPKLNDNSDRLFKLAFPEP